MVATPQFITKPGAKEWREIVGKYKEVYDFGGFVLCFARWEVLEQYLTDVQGQNAADTIVAEPFAGLVPNDVLDRPRPAVCVALEIKLRVNRELVWGTHNSTWNAY